VITGFLIILLLAYVKFVTGCVDVVLYEYSVDVYKDRYPHMVFADSS